MARGLLGARRALRGDRGGGRAGGERGWRRDAARGGQCRRGGKSSPPPTSPARASSSSPSPMPSRRDRSSSTRASRARPSSSSRARTPPPSRAPRGLGADAIVERRAEIARGAAGASRSGWPVAERRARRVTSRRRGGWRQRGARDGRPRGGQPAGQHGDEDAWSGRQCPARTRSRVVKPAALTRRSEQVHRQRAHPEGHRQPHPRHPRAHAGRPRTARSCASMNGMAPNTKTMHEHHQRGRTASRWHSRASGEERHLGSRRSAGRSRLSG